VGRSADTTASREELPPAAVRQVDRVVSWSPPGVRRSCSGPVTAWKVHSSRHDESG